MRRTTKALRKLAIAIIGFTILIFGVLLLVLPGPGIVVILAGLFVLSLEFAWAECQMEKIKTTSKQASDKIRNKKPPSKDV